MVPFVQGDHSKDFWKQNPEVRLIPPFQELYKKNHGGRMMWALYLLEDVKSSFHNFPPEEREQLVLEQYIKKDFTIASLKKYREPYTTKLLTEKERFYKTWGLMLYDFDESFKKMDFKKDTDSKLKMLDKRDKIWKSYLEAERSVREEMKHRVEGDRIESLIETGDI